MWIVRDHTGRNPLSRINVVVELTTRLRARACHVATAHVETAPYAIRKCCTYH